MKTADVTSPPYSNISFLVLATACFHVCQQEQIWKGKGKLLPTCSAPVARSLLQMWLTQRLILYFVFWGVSAHMISKIRGGGMFSIAVSLNDNYQMFRWSDNCWFGLKVGWAFFLWSCAQPRISSPSMFPSGCYCPTQSQLCLHNFILQKHLLSLKAQLLFMLNHWRRGKTHRLLLEKSACRVPTTGNIFTAISVKLTVRGSSPAGCTRAMNAFNLCSFYGAGTEVWHFSVVVRLRYEVEYIFNINIAAKTCCVNIYSSEVTSSLSEQRQYRHLAVYAEQTCVLWCSIKMIFSSQCFLFLCSRQVLIFFF